MGDIFDEDALVLESRVNLMSTTKTAVSAEVDG